LQIEQEIIISTLNTQNELGNHISPVYTRRYPERVNEDSRAICYAFLCDYAIYACSSPDGPGQQRAIGRRQNINREGCFSNENNFASVW